MSSVAPSIVPQFQTVNTPFNPALAKQRNIDMLQQPRMQFFSPAVNNAPYRADMNSVGYDKPPAILQQGPTMKPMTDQTQATTVTTYNAMNLNPRTLMNHAQATFGNARDQLSLITNLDLNAPKEKLIMDNSKVFRSVEFDMRTAPVIPSRV